MLLLGFLLYHGRDKTLFARIWAAIQKLEAAPRAAPKPPKKAKATKAVADVATPAPDACTPRVPREFSKKAIVRDLLTRAGGATLEEIMEKTGWQKHTVRGFMAGTMKKAGYTVESFKPEGGERTYRINK